MAPDEVEERTLIGMSQLQRSILARPPEPQAEATQEFHCLEWPRCECPDGTFALDCPAVEYVECVHLGVLVDKTDEARERERQFVTNAWIAAVLTAGIVAAMIVADMSAISDRLADAVGMYPV